MPWISMPGVTGKVYVPEAAGGTSQKHPCTTCFACQWCDETRCRVCRDGRDEAEGAIGPAAKQCCNGEQRPCISNPKSQAPNHK